MLWAAFAGSSCEVSYRKRGGDVKGKGKHRSPPGGRNGLTYQVSPGNSRWSTGANGDRISRIPTEQRASLLTQRGLDLTSPQSWHSGLRLLFESRLHQLDRRNNQVVRPNSMHQRSSSSHTTCQDNRQNGNVKTRLLIFFRSRISRSRCPEAAGIKDEGVLRSSERCRTSESTPWPRQPTLLWAATSASAERTSNARCKRSRNRRASR